MQDPAIIRGLYAITPDRTDDDLLISQVEQVINGGVKLIQYRAKTIGKNQKKIQASALKALCDKRNVKLIINDDIELSMHLDTFGVHLGKDDDTINKARKILGPNKCIGASCYNSIDRAKEAHKQSADYIAFGAFYPTPTKPHAPRASAELIAQARTFYKLPIVAIGGITLENIPNLLDKDINAVALISSIFNAGNIEARTRKICNLLESNQHE